MIRDQRGIPLATGSAEAAVRLDHAILHYCTYRTDTPMLLQAAAEADPGWALPPCLRGYFMMLSQNQANVPLARAALGEAEARLGRAGDERERGHVAALAAWAGDDVHRAIDLWDDLLKAEPTDLLALRLAHFSLFWLGENARMRDQVERVAPAWTSDLPGAGLMQGVRAFAFEECGEYGPAERCGRAAVAQNEGDLWAIHAVAHVLEMQGRADEGVGWLRRSEPNWAGANNFVHHLWWHRCLFHLERGETADALGLYDTGVRDLGSPLVKTQPDLYIDIQNAVALLWRLEHLGVAVGGRWGELADLGERRIGDHRNLFTLPHWMLALMSDGRVAAADAMLAALAADAADGKSSQVPALREAVLPTCAGIHALKRGDAAGAVERLLAARPHWRRLGASHAQRDLLSQILLSAAVRAGRSDVVARLVADEQAARPVPAAQRSAYARWAAG